MTQTTKVVNTPSFPSLEFEKRLWKKGLSWIGGIDEAGRGALAGPVSAAVVVLPPQPSLSQTLRGVHDSKQMTPLQREYWAPRIQEIALAWGVGFASAEEIDTVGIVPATRLAAMRALESLSLSPGHLLLDYWRLPECPLPQTALVKGDRRSLSIAAASVLAKTSRDALMRELDAQYPGYTFARHKGYGTPQHRQALRRLGLCPIHRKSFAIKSC